MAVLLPVYINIIKSEVHFLGAFERSQKAPVTFVLSVHLYICPHVSAWLAPGWFKWNFVLRTFLKMRWGIPDLLKFGKNIRHLTWAPKYILLLPVTLYQHKSPVFGWNIIRFELEVFHPEVFVQWKEVKVSQTQQ